MPKPRPTDIAALYARADKQLDQFPKGFDGAKELLQQVLAAEPDHLDALHSLNWAWERDRDFHPATWQQELREPQLRLREHILALTRGVKPGGRETTGHKARALALAQHAEDLLRDAPSLETLKAVEAALAQSEALRDDLPSTTTSTPVPFAAWRARSLTGACTRGFARRSPGWPGASGSRTSSRACGAGPPAPQGRRWQALGSVPTPPGLHHQRRVIPGTFVPLKLK